jgi:hypothetical protein
VGVISDFRKDGELEPAGSYAFFRNNLDSPPEAGVPRWLVVRVARHRCAVREAWSGGCNRASAIVQAQPMAPRATVSDPT